VKETLLPYAPAILVLAISVILRLTFGKKRVNDPPQEPESQITTTPTCTDTPKSARKPIPEETLMWVPLATRDAMISFPRRMPSLRYKDYVPVRKTEPTKGEKTPGREILERFWEDDK
jgi:hypothetical protein